MDRYPRSQIAVILFTGLLLCCTVAGALQFEPGVGIGAEYTDNARLTPDNTVSDLITLGYVGAQLSEDKGALTYNANTAFNNLNYTQDTYKEKHYFNLAARADWAMIKDRFNWSLKDYYSQLPINSVDPNTPNNLQDSNAFIFGADFQYPVSARNSFSLSPYYSQYYYENLATDNKQQSLQVNWKYQMFRLTSIGLNLGARHVNYTETDNLGNSIQDVTFTNAGIVVNGQRLRSNYSISLGTTSVKRVGSGVTSGFAGNINWLAELSSRSKFVTLLSTGLTDTSTVVANSVEDPINGNPNDVQITTDVVRNSIFNLAYLREDNVFKSRLWANYREVTYSESPLDNVVRDYGAQINRSVTQLLTVGAYVNYSHTKRLDTGLIENRYAIGSNLQYQLTRKLNSLLNVKYRTRESTDSTQNYNEFSVFASLVYGFGNVITPTRVGSY